MKFGIKGTLLFILIFAIVAIPQFFAVELSYSDYTQWGNVAPINFVVGYLTVLTVSVALLFIFNRPWIALSVSTVITTVTAIANFYILETRGTPFSFVQLQNFFTAMNVISSYRFDITPRVEQIIAVGVVLLVVSFFLGYMKGNRLVSGIVVIVLGILMCHSYTEIIPRNVVGWSWDSSVKQYGYTTCLTQCTLQSTVAIVQPESYNETALRNYIADYEVTEPEANNTPDIIFILNESWYDLNQVTDVKATKNVFSYIRSLKNTLQGSCVVPCAAGGTNVSEYEYLTGNTISLAPNSNPFNTIDISKGNSFATHLESLGYESVAMHTESGANYSRDMAFPALGFDTVYFRDSYGDPDWYGQRYYYPTDAWAYRHLTQWYEEMGDGPRVMYLLTVQNHGGYESLRESEYLVRTRNDYGEYTGQVNEFLTCMSLTDNGFRTLVNYFKRVDRDVIICMVGDHAPAFAPYIADSELASEEYEILIRSVPYVIWSNNINLRKETAEERISLHYMPSYVMDLANVKLSPYFDITNELRKQVPVYTSYEVYVDAEGNIYHSGEVSPYKELLDRQLGLTYANMKKLDFMMDGSYVNKKTSAAEIPSNMATTTSSSVSYQTEK